VGSILPVEDYLYVTTTGDMGGMWAVHVIDMRDPAHPRLVRRIGSDEFGTVFRLWSPTFITRIGNYVYLSGIDCCGTRSALGVLDVRNPVHPLLVGRTDFEGGISRNRVLPIADSRILWCLNDNNAEVFEISELPAFIGQFLQDDKLNVQWNDAAKGMKLQRAGSLTQPDWQDVPRSEATNSVTLPMENSTGFFRLVKP